VINEQVYGGVVLLQAGRCWQTSFSGTGEGVVLCEYDPRYISRA
jgi:hypothetical protein